MDNPETQKMVGTQQNEDKQKYNTTQKNKVDDQH